MKKRSLTPRAAIREWIRDNNITNKSEIILRCMACMEQPDIKKLISQYWNRVANSMTASVRDDDNDRIAFPISNGVGVQVHNIEKTLDFDALRIISRRCDMNIRGNTRTKKKINLRQAELAGQISLDFEKANGS
jgi:hypothetical protein